MTTLKHTCEECDSSFTIRYDEEEVADRPTYCVFCSSYILDEQYGDEEEE